MSPDTILVVDDNEDDIFLLRHALRKAGLRNPVEVANDGPDCISLMKQALRASKVDGAPILPLFIFLEIRLRTTTGFELLKKLRSIPDLSNLITIFLTSTQEEDQVSQAYELGAHSYLVKPVGPSDLRAVIEIISSKPLSQILKRGQLPGIKSKSFLGQQ